MNPIVAQRHIRHAQTLTRTVRNTSSCSMRTNAKPTPPMHPEQPPMQPDAAARQALREPSTLTTTLEELQIAYDRPAPPTPLTRVRRRNPHPRRHFPPSS